MTWLISIWQWTRGGGWKVFLGLGVAIGLAFSVIYVVNKLEEFGKLQAQYQVIQNQQNADIQRISEQNEANQQLLQTVRDNTATIGQLRTQLRELGETITADVDPTQFQSEIEQLIINQYMCLEKISRNESNATCS